MSGSFKIRETKQALEQAHAHQRFEALPERAWKRPPDGAFNLFVFFNLEASWDEGHAILGLGPVGRAIQTYSFYRHSSKVEAPGIMACLREPTTFRQIQDRSGWIVHGQPGNFWNEHMNAAVALWCARGPYEAIRAFAEERRVHSGTYNLVKNNCLTFVEDALAAGGVQLLTTGDRPLHTFIPKEAFGEVTGARGAHRFEAWEYWFPITEPPRNGLRSISDEPGKNRPLE